MKKGIHPELKDCKVICACGSEFDTKSVKDEIHVEVCSECHPFYTGEQGKTKKTGTIEKFKNKWNLKDKTAE